MSYWSSKFHGFHWGNYEQKPDAPNNWLLENYERTPDISKTDGTRHCFQFGNDWPAFQHFSKYNHTNWTFIDNHNSPH